MSFDHERFWRRTDLGAHATASDTLFPDHTFNVAEASLALAHPCVPRREKAVCESAGHVEEIDGRDVQSLLPTRELNGFARQRV